MKKLQAPILFIALAAVAGCSPNYKVKDGRVFRVVDAVGYYNEIILEEADSKTFEDLGNGYAKDCCSVFWLDDLVASANPKSIKVLGQSYATDSNQVFHKGWLIHDADPNSFTIISKHENFSRDKNHVFFGDKSTDVLNPNKFEIVYDGSAARWGSDGVNYYHFGNFTGHILLESDYPSTQILSERYAIDKDSAYFENQEIIGADISSFKVLQTYFARDKFKVYFEHEQISDADADSFVASNSWFSRDKNCKYKRTEKVECN